LKGATLDWCRSLSASGINSLASFHDAFNIFYKEKISAESLFENCCDVFEKHIQHKAEFSSVFQNKNNVSEEDLQDTIDDINEDFIAVDAFDLVPDTLAILDLNEETIIEEDFSQILQDFSYDIF
jgi:hypothetical protein